MELHKCQAQSWTVSTHGNVRHPAKIYAGHRVRLISRKPSAPAQQARCRGERTLARDGLRQSQDRYVERRLEERGYDFAPPPNSSSSSSGRGPPGGPPPSPPSGGPGGGGDFSGVTKAFIAGAFMMGIGAGVWFTSEANFQPSNVASTEMIDRQTPNSQVCMANGYSSMVFDQRIFVSFNPFNVYVAQPEVKPGCVLRRSNVRELESRGLVDSAAVTACKRNMNTFAFVGDLENSPEVSCVYHSEEAENQFLTNPRKSVLGDGFQARGDLAQADEALLQPTRTVP